MKQHRLIWLLIVMGALLAAKWWFPPRSEPTATLVEAVVRPSRPSVVSAPLVSEARVRTTNPTLPAASSAPAWALVADVESFSNAFAARPVPTPPPVPSPPVSPVVTPPAPPKPIPPQPAPAQVAERVPTLPPMQVIGTWDDGGKSPGVFIALPRGTVLAQVGTVLLAEYRVTAVSPQQISLLHIESKQPFSLPVPRASARQ